MARPSRGAWDFVEVGKEYQYKEDSLVATVLILEDYSVDDWYEFKVQVLESNYDMSNNQTFMICHRQISEVYSGMPQLYKHPEYIMLPIGTPWKYNYREDGPKVYTMEDFLKDMYETV